MLFFLDTGYYWLFSNMTFSGQISSEKAPKKKKKKKKKKKQRRKEKAG
jgi:hypothetical protein